MKLALLMGLNYRGSNGELNGCINDINNTYKILTDVYNYKSNNICLMTDDTELKPTGRNICEKMIELARKTRQEQVSELWISYSGHGSYIKDKNGDEDDGRDECLVPLDYENGVITDDVINNFLSIVNPNTNIIFIVDACHSETMLDLKYRYISGNKNVIENKNCKIKANCIMISGCKDDQTSSDAYNINNSKEYSGAMTSALLYVLENHEYTITCFKLLKEMRKFLRKRRFSQIPQICCSKKILNSNLFSSVKPIAFITN